METKICWRCPVGVGPQPLSNFTRGGKDGVCKQCRYQINSEWAKNNREKLRSKRTEYMRKYRADKAAKKLVGSDSAQKDEPVQPSGSAATDGKER